MNVAGRKERNTRNNKGRKVKEKNDEGE